MASAAVLVGLLIVSLSCHAVRLVCLLRHAFSGRSTRLSLKAETANDVRGAEPHSDLARAMASYLAPYRALSTLHTGLPVINYISYHPASTSLL